MDNRNIKVTIFSLVFALQITAQAHSSEPGAKSNSNSDELSQSIIEQFIPETFKKARDGSAASIGNGIGTKKEWIKLDKKGEKKAAAILYYNNSDDCELRVIQKKGKNWVILSPTQLQIADQLQFCRNIAIKDLDQNGVDEVLVESGDGGESPALAIFKWDGSKMVDVTPMEIDSTGNKVSKLRTAMVADKPVNDKLLIIDVDENNPTAGKRIYEFRNGVIELQGVYDFISFIGAKKNEYTVLNPKLESPAQYFLKVRNLSDHNRSVRAEVVVNGSVVLKPSDFCVGSQPSKTQKDKWSGNDDDDDDRDRCKRCKAKDDVYAIVNMQTANEIKVKVFGKRDSKVEITLVKKP